MLDPNLESRLLVSFEGGTFRWEGGDAVDLRRRASLRKVFLCLAQARDSHAGGCVPSAQLVAAGWPGEQILPEAKRNRLHVAIASLRKLGLGQALLTGDGGYLIDPEIAFELVTRPIESQSPQGQQGEDANHSRRATGDFVEAPLPGLVVDLPALPAESSSFVGRKRELQELALALQSPEQRLSTLIGLGGTGKTRLALAFGRARQALGEELLYLDLRSARDEEDLCLLAAQPLQLVGGDVPTATQIGAVLAARGALLLIADNLENVIEAAQRCLAKWLAMAPTLRILGTSRVPLGLPAEHRFALGGLCTAEATQLFTSRAKTARPGFDPTNNGDDLQALIADLDGLPLPLELAAQQVRSLPIHSIRSSLERTQRLETPTKSATSAVGTEAPEKRPTGQGEVGSCAHFVSPAGPSAAVEAALRWSWERLSLDEQQLLTALTHFRGGFTLPAVEAIVELSPNSPWVGGLIHALCEQGLIEVDAGEEAWDLRYQLLVSVGQFAASHTQEFEALSRQTARNHARYFGALGQSDRRTYLYGPIDSTQLRQLLREQGNLYQAFHTGLTLRERDAAAGAALSLATLYSSVGPLRRAATLLERALEGEPPSQILEAACRIRLAGLVNWQSEDRTQAIVDAARKAARRSGDPSTEAEAMLVEAVWRFENGQTDLAESLAQDARSVGQMLERHALVAAAGNLLCVIARQRGEFETALSLGSEALSAARRANDARRVAIIEQNLAGAEIQAGHLDKARALYERALRSFAQLRERQALAHTLGNLASIELLEGNLDEARRGFERALQIHKGLGQARGLISAQGNLGMVELEAGEYDRAIRLLEVACERAAAAGLTHVEGAFLSGLGEATGCLGQVERSVQQFDRAEILLRKALDESELGILLCRRGRVALEAQDEDRSLDLLAQAKVLAKKLGHGPTSELGHAITRLERGINPHS